MRVAREEKRRKKTETKSKGAKRERKTPGKKATERWLESL